VMIIAFIVAQTDHLVSLYLYKWVFQAEISGK
jgi:hypothetical protein